ncbi:MAG: hypothetical protein H6799_00350 [Candidatus Nomurabacteria bacterium]|nr:MAG: hypothetical protein H6799_00350 [Candidatus Nomurabacteria bacterium]HRV76281.1 hypothetical protein [Candidatus Saccharimonadales bacterium]
MSEVNRVNAPGVCKICPSRGLCVGSVILETNEVARTNSGRSFWDPAFSSIGKAIEMIDRIGKTSLLAEIYHENVRVKPHNSGRSWRRKGKVKEVPPYETVFEPFEYPQDYPLVIVSDEAAKGIFHNGAAVLSELADRAGECGGPIRGKCGAFDPSVIDIIATNLSSAEESDLE